MTGPTKLNVIPLKSPKAPSQSEEAMALDFAQANEETLRYVAATGQWFRFEFDIWSVDTTLATYDSIRALARRRAVEVETSGGTLYTAKKIASAKTVAAVERLARSDRRLAATIDQWDADPALLSVPGGVVDLETGASRRGMPDDYMTKRTAVAPEARAATPKWSAFLDFATAGDPDLADFLQRMAGYMLTGVTREQALFFLYGAGKNGKSVFVNVISRILCDYAQQAVMETFIDTGRNEHPTDLAMLRGARLVTASETEKGRRWAESRIKQMTGGDPITARFMRQDFFTYTPQFKLLITGNHKPSLKSVDVAIRRRLHLIPFTQEVPDDRKDDHLEDKLMGEAPGILHWMIEGCLKWQAGGLAPPQRVREATEAYFSEEDTLGRWIEEQCETNPGVKTPSAVLFANWRCWAENAGEHAGSRKAFTQALNGRGFASKRMTGGAGGIAGLKLRRSVQEDVDTQA